LYDLYGFRRSSSGANGLNVWKFIKKLAFFGFSQKKIQITAQNFCFFPLMTHAGSYMQPAGRRTIELLLSFDRPVAYKTRHHVQTKNNQLAEYDIVGMFAENLVEVGYVCLQPYTKEARGQNLS
jgi:hypothetical protein